VTAKTTLAHDDCRIILLQQLCAYLISHPGGRGSSSGPPAAAPAAPACPGMPPSGADVVPAAPMRGGIMGRGGAGPLLLLTPPPPGLESETVVEMALAEAAVVTDADACDDGCQKMKKLLLG
jgi:hypothetical protein